MSYKTVRNAVTYVTLVMTFSWILRHCFVVSGLLMYFLVYNTYRMHQINRFNLLVMVKSSLDAWIIALLGYI